MPNVTRASDHRLKRIIDVVIAGGATIGLAPIAAIALLVVALRLGRPLLYSDRRVGLDGRPIVIRKFRTMLDLRNSDGQLLPDVQRLPAAGRILRSLSVDELPQLFSVLSGEMSLVGPRPLPTRYLERYSPEQARRHEVKPGITGLAQVSGRNLLSWDEKFALDVWYVDNWSLWLDVKILFRTFWQVVNRSGIQAEGEATMGEFMGSEAVVSCEQANKRRTDEDGDRNGDAGLESP